MAKIERQEYFKMVSFVINSMLDLAETEPSYNFNADLNHYYETTIKKENVISYLEFMVMADILAEYRKK